MRGLRVDLSDGKENTSVKRIGGTGQPGCGSCEEGKGGQGGSTKKAYKHRTLVVIRKAYSHHSPRC